MMPVTVTTAVICQATCTSAAVVFTQPSVTLVATSPIAATVLASHWAVNQPTRSSAWKVSRRCISLASTVEMTVAMRCAAR